MKQKIRLDARLKELYPAIPKTALQSYIMQGKVSIDGIVCTKPGTQVDQDDTIVLLYEAPRYVSRAGYKLEKALEEFSIVLEGMIALDAGISTGGFTDCLLQKGISKVYGIDVGFGQVHEKIRHDSRVEIKEKTNLRYLESLPEKVDLATLDLSFISLEKVLPAVSKLLKKEGIIIALIKPQFEAERGDVGKGGIIKDPQVHERIVTKVIGDFKRDGFTLCGFIESPVLGSQGNKEFLGYFKKDDQT